MASSFATVGNQKWTTLNEDLDTTETGIDVVSASALGVSGIASPNYAYAVIITAASAWRKPSTLSETFEIVKITAESGNTLTVTRGQDGTSGTAFSTGDIIALRPCGVNFSEIHTALTGGASGGDLAINDLDIYGDFDVASGGADLTWSRWLLPNTGNFFTRSVNPCSAATRVNPAAQRTELYVFDFDDTAVEGAMGLIMLPEWYDARAITFEWMWYAAAASGTVVWQNTCICHENGDALTATPSLTYASLVQATGGANILNTGTASMTPVNAATGGKILSVVVTRVGNHGSDSLVGDARLVGVRVSF